MSRSSKHAVLERFQFPNSSKLWHEGVARTRSLGCGRCHYRQACGGLQVEAMVYDCLSFCNCPDPTKCDNVCPRNAQHLVARLQEVGGTSLDNVPRAPKLAAITLPPMVPMVYHSYARKRVPCATVVALSLYEFFDKRTGELRFTTRNAVLDRFKLADDATFILSGTDDDVPLERWWRLTDRDSMPRGLAALGVKLITTPNYSLFDDVPRTDNMYNMKRIALVSSEIQGAGVLCALHVNARTDRDWDRWIEFLGNHDEYEYVAFEFGTGAGARTRMRWHTEQLSRLANDVGRPLSLLVRGGLGALSHLGQAFNRVTFIDTAAFIKAQRRQRAVFAGAGLAWEKSPTPTGEPIDELFDANIRAIAQHTQTLLRKSN